jgi:hypothetical protein
MFTRFLQAVDCGIIAAATVGALMSILLAIVGVWTFPAPMPGWCETVTKALLIAFLPVGMLFVIRHNQLTPEHHDNDLRFERLGECPIWMRATVLSLMVLGISLFLQAGLYELLGYIPHSHGGHVSATVPGGFGMAFCATMIGQLYSACALAKKTGDMRVRVGGAFGKD